MKPDTTTALIAISGFLFYSLSDAGIKLGSADYSTMQIATTVMIFGLIPTVAHMWQQGVLRTPLPKKPGLMLVLCILRLGQIPCMFYAFANMPMSLVYAAAFTMPLATSAMGAVFLGEKTGPRRILAICAGFAGVLIAIDPLSITFEIGHLALIAMPLLGAASNIVIRMSAPHEALSIMSFWPNVALILVLSTFGGSTFQPMPVETLNILAATAFLAWLGTLSFTHAVRRGPVISASSMQYSQVIWGGLIGYLVFGEMITQSTLIGSVVIIAAGLYIMLRAEDEPAAPVMRADIPQRSPIRNT